jgi:uncharacterized membrane protein
VTAAGPPGRPDPPGPLLCAGVLIGAGLGGFLDGIVLHQVLQWHHLLSSRVPPVDLRAIKFNMVWDGVFHLLTWAMTAVGIALLWRARAVRWPGRALAGAIAIGWGLFNLIEGTIDHQLLGVHHVRPGAGQLGWDLAFLASGVLLCALGAAAIGPLRRRVQLEPAPS